MDRIETSSGVYLIGSAPVAAVRLNLSVYHISHGTLFLSHNELTSAALSTAETIKDYFSIDRFLVTYHMALNTISEG